MSKVKIELNSPGIKELLKSEEISDAVAAVAVHVAQKCGDGYESDKHMMPGRAVSAVLAATDAAYRDNLENNTLLKAVSG